MSPKHSPSNREALLEGALRCLQERGYARTTARDIVAASATNLGAIGYHYGSTERLLNLALLEGFERWYVELAEAVAGASHETQPFAVLGVLAKELPRTFERNRPLVRALIEAMAQAEQSDEIREGLIEGYARGRELVLQLLGPLDSHHREAQTLGSVVIALYDGLLIQWLIDPENAPTGEDLTALLPLLADLARAA